MRKGSSQRETGESGVRSMVDAPVQRPDAEQLGLLQSVQGDVKPRGDAGAPAALRAIEEHEVRCREEKEIARDLWKAAQTNLCEGDEVSERTESRTRQDYLHALEIWDDATKKLALFDKTVAPEKRTGEKILKSEVEEIIRQLRLSLTLGIESYIIRACDTFTQPATQQDAYKMHAENIRDCFSASIESAKREGALPAWVEFR